MEKQKKRRSCPLTLSILYCRVISFKNKEALTSCSLTQIQQREPKQYIQILRGKFNTFFPCPSPLTLYSHCRLDIFNPDSAYISIYFHLVGLIVIAQAQSSQSYLGYHIIQIQAEWKHFQENCMEECRR